MSEVTENGVEGHDASEELKEANTLLGTGVGIGVIGAAGAAISGAVCPLCVLFTPVLVGSGIYKRLKAKRQA